MRAASERASVRVGHYTLSAGARPWARWGIEMLHAPPPHPLPHHPLPHPTLCPTTLCPTTLCPTILCPTTLCPTTLCPTTLCPTTLCPTTLCPTTLCPTTLCPTTLLAVASLQVLTMPPKKGYGSTTPGVIFGPGPLQGESGLGRYGGKEYPHAVDP